MRELAASVLMLAIPCAVAAAPAARVGDVTSHGGSVATGSPTVRIGGLPAARQSDTATCPIVEGPVAHAGGPIVTGAATVLINGRPAARAGDAVQEAAGPGSVIVGGSSSVFIGGSPAAPDRATGNRARRAR